jgi:hypothetical protein
MIDYVMPSDASSFNEGVDNRKGCPLDSSLAVFNSVTTWSYAIIFVCMCRGQQKTIL